VSTSPIVSVCVASYNRARFLPAMLDGILSQTFRDFEIVAVDDGYGRRRGDRCSPMVSKDPSEDFIRELATLLSTQR
jgi:hypothetical protein